MSEAEELVQETWVRGVERLEGFAWRSSLKTWLAGIALNTWRERRRAPAAATLDDDRLPEAPPARHEIASVDLERALSQLSPGYREAILLHDVAGYTHEEIAALTGDRRRNVQESTVARAPGAAGAAAGEDRMNGNNDELTPEEARALRSLTEGEAPPAALERATVARLRERGLLAGRRRSRSRWLLAAAAGIALFCAGVLVGHRRPEAPSSAAEGPRFVLFLYDAPSEPELTDAQMQERVSEYRNWAIGLRESGADIRGEKLKTGGRRLGSASAGEAPLGGYFIVSAKDWSAAMEIARSCPHLKHGGTVEVREIEKT